MAVRTQDFEFLDFGDDYMRINVRIEWARGDNEKVFMAVETAAEDYVAVYLTTEQAKELGYALLYVAGEGDDNAD